MDYKKLHKSNNRFRTQSYDDISTANDMSSNTGNLEEETYLSDLREQPHKPNGIEERKSIFSEIDKILNKGFLKSKDYKVKSVFVAVVTALMTLYVLSLLATIIKQLTNPYRQSLSLNPITLISQLSRLESTSVLFILTLVALSTMYITHKYIKEVTEIDKRKIVRSKNDTYGSSNWMNYDKKLMSHLFEQQPLAEPVGVPLGKLNDKVLCMPEEPKYDQFSNQNMIIVGGSGSGKSFSGINPIIFSRIMYGQSFVVSDTKGDLYRDSAALAQKFGYKVSVFNLKNPLASDSWDALKEIKTAPEDKLHDIVDIYVNIIIENTKPKNGKSEKFWEDNESNLLRALLFYVCKSDLYTGERTINGLTKLLNTSSIDELDQKLGAVGQSDPTYMAYANIKNMSSSELKDKFRSGLATRLHKFTNSSIGNILSYDEISFDDLISGKYAIYLVTNDDNSAYDFINSLFMTCLYNKLNRIAESRQFGGRLPTKVYLVLDEFANMAYIPDFNKKISTNRSKGIVIIFSIQSIEQLGGIYKGEENTIIGQCATLLFYGANDKTTLKYISDRTGTMTVSTTSKMIEEPIYNRFHIPLEQKRTTSDNKRSLLNPDEVEALSREGKQCLIFVTGKGVAKADCYTQLDHPLSKYCEKLEPNDNRGAWVDEYFGEGTVLEDSEEYIFDKDLISSQAAYVPEDSGRAFGENHADSKPVSTKPFINFGSPSSKHTGYGNFDNGNFDNDNYNSYSEKYGDEHEADDEYNEHSSNTSHKTKVSPYNSDDKNNPTSNTRSTTSLGDTSSILNDE